MIPKLRIDLPTVWFNRNAYSTTFLNVNGTLCIKNLYGAKTEFWYSRDAFGIVYPNIFIKLFFFFSS